MSNLDVTWADLYDEAQLYKSALKVYTKPLFTPSKGFVESNDEENLFDFAVQSTANLQELHSLLQERNFDYRPARVCTLHLNSKKRHLFIYPWKEKIVDATLYYTLTSRFDQFFDKKSYAYRPEGGGVDKCQSDIIKYLKENKNKNIYIIKRDISNYFPSIDHNILWTKLLRHTKDPFLLSLLAQRIRFPFYTKNEEIQYAEQGVPFGTPIACFLANLYLDEVDKAFKQLNVAYYRYADDFLIMTTSRNEALKAIDLFEEHKTKLNLTCKPSHYQNLILSSSSTEDQLFSQITKFQHLGLEYRVDRSVGLSREKQRKILKLVKNKINKYKTRYKKLSIEERAERLIEKANAALTDGLKQIAIVDYYLKHVTDEKQIRLIDRYIAETILAVATKRGYKKSNFKIVPYKRLRELGLISLLHRKRLIAHGYLETSFFKLRNERRERSFKEKKQKESETVHYYKRLRSEKRLKKQLSARYEQR